MCEAVTLIGLRITDDQLKRPITLNYINCACPNNNNNYRYCPDCGDKNTYGTYIHYAYIDHFKVKVYDDSKISEDELPQYINLVGTLTMNNNFYHVYKPLEHENWLYVTIYYGIKDQFNNVVKTSLDVLDHVNTFKHDLTSIGLFDDNQFGIYTLLVE